MATGPLGVPLLLPAIFTFPPDVRGLPWGCRCADGRGRSGGEYKSLRGCQSLVGGAGSSLGGNLGVPRPSFFSDRSAQADSRWPIPLPSPTLFVAHFLSTWLWGWAASVRTQTCWSLLRDLTALGRSTGGCHHFDRLP